MDGWENISWISYRYIFLSHSLTRFFFFIFLRTMLFHEYSTAAFSHHPQKNPLHIHFPLSRSMLTSFLLFSSLMEKHFNLKASLIFFFYFFFTDSSSSILILVLFFLLLLVVWKLKDVLRGKRERSGGWWRGFYF